jgi:mannose-6-phosphate isomerase-like protein (cupin superfamily)
MSNPEGPNPKQATTPSANGRFDIATIAAAFPPSADTLLVDEYMTNRPEASSRVFRVYRPTPPHYHETCDEYLYVFSGRGTFWMEDPATEAEFKPGQLLFFARNTVHAMPKLFEHPVVFLSVDTPRRAPTDIIFVNPEDGTPQTFMARNAKP